MNLFSYARSVAGRKGWQIAAVSAAMVTAAFLDIVVLATIALMVEIVGIQTGESVQSGVGWLRKIFGYVGIEPTVWTAFAFASSVALTRAVLVYTHSWMSGRLRGQYEAQLKIDTFDALINSSWSHLLSQRSGDLVNTITVECRRAGLTYFSFILALAAALNVLTYVVIAIVVMWQAALGAVLFVAVSLLAFRILIRRAHIFGKRASASNSALNVAVAETLQSAKFVKGGALEEPASLRLRPAAHELGAVDIGMGQNSGLLQGGFEFAVIFVLLLGLAIAGAAATVPTATLALFVLLFVRIYQRARVWQQSYQTFGHNYPSAERVWQVQAEAQAAAEPSRPTAAPELSSTLALQDVVFAYHSGQNVLNQVSLELPVGSMTALVGPSGTGKTTLVDIVLGLLTPQSGHVLIDGIPLDSVDVRSWRKQIGYVTQDMNLFYDTVASNIAWGDASASKNDIEEVARMAGAHEFIERLPDGYETIIGDRGLRISGGQRQRIALARAFFRSPRLLILDEATSELDRDSEARIQETIERIRGDLTVLVVAHRLDTVMTADKLVVLDNGRVIESGNPRDLVAANGVFAKMFSERDRQASEGLAE